MALRIEGSGTFGGDFLLVCTIWKTFQLRDMEAFSDCCHFATMITNMSLITMSFLYNRKGIENILTGAGFGFFHYGDTLDVETKRKVDDILKNADDSKKFNVKMFKWIIFACSGALMMKGIVNFIRYHDTIDAEGNTLSRKHTLAFWHPFVSTWSGYVFGCCMCYFNHFFVTNNILGYILPVISFSKEITSQMQVIQTSLKCVTARARHMYEIRYRKRDNFDKQKYEKCIEEALKMSVQHHIVILNASRDLERLMSLPLFTVMFATAFLLCMSGFLLIEDNVPLFAKTASMVFAGAELLYGYLFCLYGENIALESEAIGDQLYEDDWLHASKTIKPYLVIIKQRSKIPSRLYAAGLFEVNLVAFSGVLRSTYSYFNLMLTSKSE